MVPARDGTCTKHVVICKCGKGGPAILFYFDAGGIRPTVIGVAQRLTDAGYVIFSTNLFYCHGTYG